MSFCPRCGAPTTASMSFCTSCGESLPPAVYPAPASAPAAAPASAPAAAPAVAPATVPPRGPVGQVMEPWLVIILTLVTLGIYQFFYWVRVAREMDEFRATPGHARKPIVTALWLMLGAIVVGFFAFYAFFSSFSFSEAEPEPSAAGAAGGGLGLLLFIAAVIAATVLLYVGQWRVWSGIETEERARAHPKPLSPGLQLVFVLVPYLNFVTFWVALYRTQDHLNALWTGRPVTP